ncbi:hypothetical protein [Flexivirga oryzae]|uniref:Uncharacterized protein n=1 Tax=Flexivirga oryzae TaxID=1794944 RepID=A0A839N5X0_9MICO|nr:hypothetical protein [Flexivirga oryzae]MBB2892667.1 hypothetical protein [Flexivirga oryzae]
MTEPSDGERPRPVRRHRRASRPATTGHPDAGHWTKESVEGDPSAADPAEEPGIERGKRRVAGADDGPESAQDRWWREQRPPHWQ